MNSWSAPSEAGKGIPSEPSASGSDGKRSRDGATELSCLQGSEWMRNPRRRQRACEGRPRERAVPTAASLPLAPVDEHPAKKAPEINPVNTEGRRAIRTEPAENGLPEGPERKPA